jgi:hypothetical protein
MDCGRAVCPSTLIGGNTQRHAFEQRAFPGAIIAGARQMVQEGANKGCSGRPAQFARSVQCGHAGAPGEHRETGILKGLQPCARTIARRCFPAERPPHLAVSSMASGGPETARCASSDCERGGKLSYDMNAQMHSRWFAGFTLLFVLSLARGQNAKIRGTVFDIGGSAFHVRAEPQQFRRDRALLRGPEPDHSRFHLQPGH